MMCVKHPKKNGMRNCGIRFRRAMRRVSRDDAMAPVARSHNRCNYVWKFLIHPIMFDNNPTFHANYQRFAAHELIFASSNFLNRRTTNSRNDKCRLRLKQIID